MYTLYYKVFSCWSAHCYPIKPRQIATGYKHCSSCSSHVTIAASRLSPAYPAPRLGRLPLREQQAQRWRARQRRRQSGRRCTRGREAVCALKGSRFLWVGLRCLLPCCLAAWHTLWNANQGEWHCHRRELSRRTSRARGNGGQAGRQAGDKSILWLAEAEAEAGTKQSTK